MNEFKMSEADTAWKMEEEIAQFKVCLKATKDPQAAALLVLSGRLSEISGSLKDFDHQICMGLAMAKKEHGVFEK